MADYASQLDRIRKASSLDEIREVVEGFSAKSTRDGGILYSRNVGDIPSEVVAKELAARTGDPIINDTPRAKFLSNAEDTIKASAERIFRAQGQSLEMAGKSTVAFLYGDPHAAARSATSLDHCLWGEASREFAASLRGDIKLVASNANLERVFGKVELPTVLANPEVASLGGQPVAKLKDLYAKGGPDAVLPEVQARFIEAAPRGVYSGVDEIGRKVTKVTLSREFAEAMGVDGKRFASAVELSSSGTVTRAPIGMDIPVAMHDAETAAKSGMARGAAIAPKQGAVVSEATVAGESAALRPGLRPGVAAKGLGIVAAAATVYDIGDTAHDVNRLHGQGNATAAQARIERFAVQNAAGWGGAVAGMGAGALAGVETGPGLLVTGAIGGIVGAVAGDKVADWLNERKINRQDDGHGNTWTFDPHHPDRAWTRTEGSLIDRLQGESRTLTADAALSDRLTRQASNTSIELALGSPPQSRDPYMLPAAAGDTRSLQRSDWTRDPKTGAWQREVVDQFLEHGIKISHAETANPQRAAQLERQSQAIVEGNAARTPAAMAAQYQAAYERNGWSRHGALPAVVTDALKHPGRVIGSDGNLYERDARGQWTHDGMLWDSRADGNLLRELEATYRAQQKGSVASITTLEPMTVRPDASLIGQSRGAAADARGVAPAGKDGRSASIDPDRARFFPMVESLGLAALDTPRKVGQVAGALESAGLRDNVEIQRVAANRDQSVVFGIQGDPSTVGGYRQTHVKVADALAMEPQAIARERENAQAMAQERDAQAASVSRQGPMLA